MFKKSLQEKLERIFQLKKTTFDDYSEHFEQDTLFIEVSDVKDKVTGSVISSRVEGSVVVFSQNNKLPYGFFCKCIEKATPGDKKDFFFFDVDRDVISSPARTQNIRERRVSFVYFFKDQYDPNKGKITELDMEC